MSLLPKVAKRVQATSASEQVKALRQRKQASKCICCSFPSLTGERSSQATAEDCGSGGPQENTGQEVLCHSLSHPPHLPSPGPSLAGAQQSLAGISSLSVQQTLTIHGQWQLLRETISSAPTPAPPQIKSIRTSANLWKLSRC